MKRAANILLIVFVMAVTAYIAYAVGEKNGSANAGVLPNDSIADKLEAYGERIRQLDNLGKVKRDIIVQYDSALNAVGEKEELMKHLERLDMLWGVYRFMMMKYKFNEDTTYLPPLDDNEWSED
ncbi:MAG: hypothetical protein J6Y39_07850 [Bacteroidaceae bacterium]|nr:hypothetical protein [Bacteroidaceae bacterium]